MVKQWLNEFHTGLSGSSTRTSYTRQHRFNSFQKWRVTDIIALLPVLLQLALALFFAGILVLLWNYDYVVAAVTTVLVAILAVVSLASFVLPAFSFDCCYISPLSIAAGTFFRLLIAGCDYGFKQYRNWRLSSLATPSGTHWKRRFHGEPGLLNRVLFDKNLTLVRDLQLSLLGLPSIPHLIPPLMLILPLILIPPLKLIRSLILIPPGLILIPPLIPIPPLLLRTSMPLRNSQVRQVLLQLLLDNDVADYMTILIVDATPPTHETTNDVSKPSSISFTANFVVAFNHAVNHAITAVNHAITTLSRLLFWARERIRATRIPVTVKEFYCIASSEPPEPIVVSKGKRSRGVIFGVGDSGRSCDSNEGVA